MSRKKMPENKSNLSGVRIAAYREKAHMTQKDLLDCINADILKENPDAVDNLLHYSTVSMWERGARKVSTKYIPSLCRVLGCTVEDLMPGGNKKPYIMSDDAFRESVTPLNIKNINDYDCKPVYCVYEDISKSNAWGLVDIKGKCIITVNHKIPLDSIGKGVAVYDGMPDYEIGSERASRAISFNTLIYMKSVYCISTSPDPTIRALYTGRYIHNEDKTCLINPWTGRALPYEGYGISYLAYSDGDVNEMVRNEVFYNEKQ